jgi:carbonyl reductase 1
VKTTLECNYYGTLGATRTFLPLIRDGGRLVNVSSTSGLLNKYSPDIEKRFRAAKTVAEISKLMEDFKAAVAAGSEKEQGWPSAAYAVSKAGLTGMTKVIAEEQRAQGCTVLINSCCPGYVKVSCNLAPFR